MAANSTDARTRAVDKMKAEPGKEMAVYQAAENQLLAIQAEQKQDLAMARAQSAATIQQNNTIAQAAEVAAAGSGAAQVQQVPINAATQGVLGKYGMGPTVSKTTTRQNQTMTKQNITINNYNTTTNNTTNNVPNTGPVQGRPVVVNRDDTGRFKVWVSNVLAKQNEQAAIRDKEFAKRESALTRGANKMTRKLESISSNLSERLDPRRTSNSFTDSLKRVLKLIGISVITANFPKVVDILVSVEKKVKNFLEYVGITGRSARKEGKKSSGLIRDIKYILGGSSKMSENSDVSVFDVFKNLLVGDGKKGGLVDVIRERIRLWLENRGEAIKAIPKPDTSVLDIPGSLKSIMEYLGNIFQVLTSGPKGMVKSVAKTARQNADKKAITEDNIYHAKSGVKENTSYGDFAYVANDADSAGAKRKLLQEDITDKDRLANNLGASLRQSSFIAANVSGKGPENKNLNPLAILSGLNRLEVSAQRNKTTLVDPAFLTALESIGVDVASIRNNSEKKKKYGYVAVKKTEDEKAQEFIRNKGLASAVGNLAGVGSAGLTSWLGGGVGGMLGGAVLGKEAKEWAEEWAQKKASEDYIFKLQEYDENKKDKYQPFKDPTTGKQLTHATYYQLNEEDLNYIKEKIGELSGKEDFSFSVDDVESTRAFGTFLQNKFSNRSMDDTYTTGITNMEEQEKKYEEYKEDLAHAADGTYVADAKEHFNEKVAEPVKDFVDNTVKVDPTKKLFESVAEGDSDGDGGTMTTPPIDSSEPGGIITANGKSFNIDAAVEEIKKDSMKVSKDVEKDGQLKFKKGSNKSASQSIGMCYRHVAQAIDVGLGNDTTLNDAVSTRTSFSGTEYAKEAGPKLEALGFRKIDKSVGTRKGDIVVFQPTDPNKAGHIAMNIGAGRWASDFIQNTFTGNRNKNAYKTDYALYRFGEGSNEGTTNTAGTVTEPTVAEDQNQSTTPTGAEKTILDLAERNGISRSWAEEAIQKASTTTGIDFATENLSNTASNAKIQRALYDTNLSFENDEDNRKILTLLAAINQELISITNINEVGVQMAAANVDATQQSNQAIQQSTAIAAANSANNKLTAEPGWTS